MSDELREIIRIIKRFFEDLGTHYHGRISNPDSIIGCDGLHPDDDDEIKKLAKRFFSWHIRERRKWAMQKVAKENRTAALSNVLQCLSARQS